MFDVGWSELIVIAVVALIVIGPKELPGVLRMIGQWMGKIRRMAAEFQGQFNEAMREAEMADLKKQFDEIKDTAKSFTGANLLTDAQKDFGDALKLEDKPSAAATSSEPAAPEAKPAEAAAPEAAAPEAVAPAAASPEADAGSDADATASNADATAGAASEPVKETGTTSAGEPDQPLPAESGTAKAS